MNKEQFDFIAFFLSCQGLLPSIRHFENRRGEGPGDEVVNNLILG